MATDILGFATKGTKSSPKAILSSSGTQKDINAFKKNAGLLGDVVGQGADDSYTKFVNQQKQNQVFQQQQAKAAKTQADAKAKQQQQQQAQKNSLLGRIKGAAGDVGKAARAVTRPVGDIVTGKGGKAVHDTAQLSSDVSGGTVNQFARGVSQAPGVIAGEIASQSKNPYVRAEGVKAVKGAQQKAFGTNDSGTIAKKIVGSTVGTATMFLGGGEAKGATVGAKSLLKQGAKVAGRQVAKDAAIGTSGNVAATVTQNPNASGKDLVKSGVVGGLLGGIAPVAVKGAGGVGRAAGGKVSAAINESDNKLVKPAKDAVNLMTGNIKQGKADVTNAALNTIMAKVKPTASMAEKANNAQAVTEQAAKTAEKNKVQAQKLDNQIELINAKKADGKFSNVDKVKVQQLEAKKQELTGGGASATKPTTAATDVVTPQSTAVSSTPAVKENVASKASVAPTDGVPVIKAYGREIKLSEENGYKAVDTPSGKVYSKVARTGRNNKDSSLSMNYYDTNGNKLTHEQAQAVIKGDLRLSQPKTEPIVTPKESATVKTDVQIPKTEKPTTTAVTEPSTRTLRPSETAHMPEVGGYTHSEHLAQDYADMLRGQEQQAKGGQIIKNADGTYKRTSEHSRFYRDFYKENGKAPTKADYLEQAKKELENGKDGIGAGGDYKKLLEREAKPVPRVQVESTVKNVPQGNAKIAQDIAKSLKEKNADVAQYSHINWKDQANKAVAVTENRELLDKIISGEAPLPDGLRATALITAIEKHPVLGKDSNLLLKIANSPLASEASVAAQELGLAAERVATSPIEAISKLRAAREAALEKKTGITVKKAAQTEIQAIRKAQPKVTRDTWDSFIESIKC